MGTQEAEAVAVVRAAARMSKNHKYEITAKRIRIKYEEDMR